ncbi:dipeptide ABC transporter ATP-binding protein [Microbacterium sp. YY-01]|uniref:dipeptide ABC transporter ATP-binding protein n=1 Tax=Microbacterium sp. YY-01 TaxID=3421634 RepID=UPI003D186433
MTTVTTMVTEPILQVRDLTVSFGPKRQLLQAVRGVNFDVLRGDVLAIVGESGSGKSVTANAIMGLHETATVRGSIVLDGKELVGAHERDLNRLRGSKISMVFQDPMTSLDPVLTIGAQIIEAVTIHNRVSKVEARNRAIELMNVVGIPRAEERLSSYPHEFSGGMRQRVVIAIALANNPSVIIADEPTTALDVTIQAQVLEALERAREFADAALVLVTHDLGVVAGVANRVAVMYGGRIVEQGTVEDVFYRPRMPYTRGLLGAIPRIDSRHERLVPIPGSPPALTMLNGTSCPFAARCVLATDICRAEEPALITVAEGHSSACHFAEDDAYLDSMTAIAAEDVVPVADHESVGDPLLTVEGLVKTFRVRAKGKKRTVFAVNGVDISVAVGETVGLVGESGSGKTTVSRAIAGMHAADSGSITVSGVDTASLRGRARAEMKRNMQMVFQDPYSSLDPRMSVEQIIGEHLALAGVPRSARAGRVAELLRMVGLSGGMAERYPHEFSGGQRQRIGIARALASDPDILILDEPVSALDVSVQAGIINLLEDLIRTRRMGYLFIAHDLAVISHISDRIAVMYLGEIVEFGAADDVIHRPHHPYTAALMSAVPIPDPKTESERNRIRLTGDLPSPLDRPDGCAFRTRCPVYATFLTEQQKMRCESEQPRLSETRHQTACFYPELVTELVSAHDGA